MTGELETQVLHLIQKGRSEDEALRILNSSDYAEVFPDGVTGSDLEDVWMPLQKEIEAGKEKARQQVLEYEARRAAYEANQVEAANAEAAQAEADLAECLTGDTWDCELTRKLREQYPDEPAAAFLARLDKALDEELARREPAKPKAKVRKDGTKAPKRTKPTNEPTRQLALFPAYRISERGDVWGPRGKKLAFRWFKSIPHVVLYDHEGKRHENRVYWLLVGAGWLESPNN